jgi:predicted DNA-binding transcriptional regulator YafY
MIVNPYGIVVRAERVFLVCTIEEKEPAIIRTLPLHRISKAEFDGPRAAAPDTFNLESYIRTQFLPVGDEGEATLKTVFDADVAEHLREAPLNKDQVMEDLNNGKVQITATVHCNMQLIWWLLGFGGHVEVLEPACIREKIAKIAGDIHRIYNY